MIDNKSKQPENKTISLKKTLWIFIERVKEERKKKNITQFQLAESAGVSLDMIKRLETGDNSVKVEVAYKIAEVLSVPLDSLFLFQQKDLSEAEIIERIHAAKELLQLLLEQYTEKLNKK